jgi:two-component system copper resistance phosphate regulon response regulator CusR
MRILVVEDDRKVAGFLEEGFREEQFEVDIAREGDEGLARARGGKYDLILLDFMLPNRSGLELATELRRGGDHTPILMLTARDDARDIQSALDAGVNAYLTKPFRFDDLLRQVGALVSDLSRPT